MLFISSKTSIFKLLKVFKRRIKRGIFIFIVFLLIFYLLYKLYEKFIYSSASNELLRILGSRDTRFLVRPDEQTVLYEPLKIRNTICKDFGSEVFLLFGVISSPNNFKERRIIRQTMMPKLAKFYVENGLQINVIFFTGIYQDEKIMERVYRESIVEGDLVIDDFHDSYMNLTLKSLRFLKWSLNTCKYAKFITKLDDDVYVNLDKFVKIVYESGDDENLMAGHLYERNLVIRDPWSKWFVPSSIYSPEYYPSYLGGFFYTMGNEAVRKIFEQSLDLEFYHLEDVFLTGTIGKQFLNLTLTNIPNIVTYWNKLMSLTTSSCSIVEFIGVHMASQEDFKCWSKFDKYYKCYHWPIWFC